MVGVGNGCFAPDDICTRAEVVQTLYALAGKPDVWKAAPAAPFDDLIQDWYQDGVSRAYSHGMTAGTSENFFEPSSNVTREQITVFLYAFASYGRTLSASVSSLSPFPDENAVSSWAQKAMQWAVGAGLMKGRAESDGVTYLVPGETATRAELAVTGYLTGYLK